MNSHKINHKNTYRDEKFEIFDNLLNTKALFYNFRIRVATLLNNSKSVFFCQSIYKCLFCTYKDKYVKKKNKYKINIKINSTKTYTNILEFEEKSQLIPFLLSPYRYIKKKRNLIHILEWLQAVIK